MNEFRLYFFRGAGPGCNSQELGDKLGILKDEIRKLEEHEQTLDTHMQWIKQSIRNIEADLKNRQFAYITYEDVKERFSDEFVLGIEAPVDTILKVPNIAKVILYLLACLFVCLFQRVKTFHIDTTVC